MKKVFDLLGLRKPTVGDVGIEIEVEGNNLVEFKDKYWGTHDDGSLRGRFPHTRAEYVLNKPVVREEVLPALQVLAHTLKDSELKFSFRTSVHVHINVQELTHVQLVNYIYTYLLLEEPLMNFCGKDRKCNRFCLRLQDAEGILDYLKEVFFRGDRFVEHIPQDEIRYASVNVEAVRKYGSLEFRGMSGNLDVERIHLWSETLLSLREFAVSMQNPGAIYDLFAEIGAVEFAKYVLKGLSKHFTYPKMNKDIQRSFSLSIDLPVQYLRSLKKEEEVEKREEFDLQIQMEHFRRMGVPDRLAQAWIEQQPRVFVADPVAQEAIKPKRVRRVIQPQDFAVFDEV